MNGTTLDVYCLSWFIVEPPHIQVILSHSRSNGPQVLFAWKVAQEETLLPVQTGLMKAAEQEALPAAFSAVAHKLGAVADGLAAAHVAIRIELQAEALPPNVSSHLPPLTSHSVLSKIHMMG